MLGVVSLRMQKTIRKFIRRRVRLLAAAAFGGWLLVALSAALSSGHAQPHPPSVLMICGFVLFGGAALLLGLWIRCPKCSRRLGQTIAVPVAFGGMKAPNFCPFCGVDLDQPMPTSPEPSEADAVTPGESDDTFRRRQLRRTTDAAP